MIDSRFRHNFAFTCTLTVFTWFVCHNDFSLDHVIESVQRFAILKLFSVMPYICNEKSGFFSASSKHRLVQTELNKTGWKLTCVCIGNKSATHALCWNTEVGVHFGCKIIPEIWRMPVRKQGKWHFIWIRITPRDCIHNE